MVNEELIMRKLNSMGLELAYIREHINDIVLTSDDIASIDQAEKDLKSGKAKRL